MTEPWTWPQPTGFQLFSAPAGLDRFWGVHARGYTRVLKLRDEKNLNLRSWPKAEKPELIILLRPDFLFNRGCV